MKYISTTELRTKSSELIEGLKLGESVNLIFRSEVVGVIVPIEVEKAMPSIDSLAYFLKLARAQNGEAPMEDSEHIYRQHMNEKYGQNIS